LVIVGVGVGGVAPSPRAGCPSVPVVAAFFQFQAQLASPGVKYRRRKNLSKGCDKKNPRVSVHFHGLRFVDSPSSLDPNDERKGRDIRRGRRRRPPGGRRRRRRRRRRQRRRRRDEPTTTIFFHPSRGRPRVRRRRVRRSVRRKTRVGDARGTAGTTVCAAATRAGVESVPPTGVPPGFRVPRSRSTPTTTTKRSGENPGIQSRANPPTWSVASSSTRRVIRPNPRFAGKTMFARASSRTWVKSRARSGVPERASTRTTRARVEKKK
jgi:hypothetical protein